VSECKMDDEEEMKTQCFGGDYMGEVSWIIISHLRVCQFYSKHVYLSLFGISTTLYQHFQVFDHMLKRMSYRRQKRWWNAYMLFYTRLDVEENALMKSLNELSLCKCCQL
jgi:ubiquitin carboxyl-terminal hydrolase 9/24